MDGEALLGSLDGVFATQVGSTIGVPHTVRVIYDSKKTNPTDLSVQSGFKVVDVDGTRPFRLGPPDQQKYYLQQTPLVKWVTELPKGGKVGDSALFATRLNAYCNGYGSEGDIQRDCVYLSEEYCTFLLDVWKEKHREQ